MNDALLEFGIGLVEKGLMPDPVTRWQIRNLCSARLEADARAADNTRFAAAMRASEIAPVPQKANEQHYEVPPEFFGLVLGAHRKYSCCFYPETCDSLDEAEAHALEITCAHAELAEGMEILELGCGWGSLSLWMAEHFPASRITAVSNSAPQRGYIESEAARRGIRNLSVITADMNGFDAPGKYDRVVSVEMFEHMRNYEELLGRIASWLKPGGKLFVHIFCHAKHAYEFETEGAHNWMGKYFFTGGIMPSADMFAHFEKHLTVEREWRWSGTHYKKTSEDWLRNLDRNRQAVLPILAQTYGAGQEERWFHRWRVFFLSCAELFGYRNGSEWLVGHYRLRLR